MSRRRVMMVAAAAAAAWCAPLAAAVAGPAATSGSWHNAIEVPGLGALNKGGDAHVTSVSCGSAGNCAAGGHYLDRSGHDQAFLAGEKNDVWGKAIEVPGFAALNKGPGIAGISSVSCRSAGNCAAGGNYHDGSGHAQAFVVSETNGTWGKAIEVPGLAALNLGGSASVASVSCGSAGNCAAGGTYADGLSRQQTFVVSERNGRWGKAIKVPGPGALEALGISSVSCRSGGNCAAGGNYVDRSGNQQAFVVSKTNGVWGKAIAVPGLAALNVGGNAALTSVSCGSAGNCAAGGNYNDGSGHDSQAFVVSETNGTWGKAIEVPGLASLNVGGQAALTSVSCGSAGNCAAGGSYMDGLGGQQAFVVSEKNGVWGKAIEVPGSLNAGGGAVTFTVSCASAGNCAAGGTYADHIGNGQAFVVSETNGTWGKAIEVPGSAALNVGGDAFVESVSCASAGECSAGGSYRDGSLHGQGFIVSQT
jgi:hypothetical protein